MKTIVLCDGRFQFYKDEKGILSCLLYGEKWIDSIDNKAVIALFDYAYDLELQRHKSLFSVEVEDL